MADLIDLYEDRLRTRGLADATVELYVSRLRDLDRHTPYGAAGATTDELAAWLYAGERSPATLQNYRKIIDGFYAWATDPRSPHLDFNPAAFLPDRQRVPRRTPRPLPADRVAQLLYRAAEPFRTWYILALYAGLRCVEISNLDRADVTAASLWVRGKGSNERVVPTDPYVWAAIASLPPGPVARSSTGERATRNEVRQRGNRHLHGHLRAPDVTMHRWRHTFATNVYQATGDIHVTRALLGHASIATTQVYADVASPAMVAAVAALPRLTRHGEVFGDAAA